MKLLAVDGTNIVMRFAHAMLQDVMGSNKRGATVEEVERVLAAVERSIRECAATTLSTHAIVALDSSVASWRKELYPEYKATRPGGVTSLWSNRLNLYLNARGWLCLRCPTFEADDILATLAARIASAGKSCAVLSGDSDLLMLTGPSCQVWQFGDKSKRFVHRDEAYIIDKFGIPSSRDLRVYKALVGETGDNLPGVRGIGRAKAQKILQTTTDIAAIRANINDVTMFDLMLTLVTLQPNVPLDPISPARCVVPHPELAHV